MVGLDGCYVHAAGQRSRTEGWFEVIVGKSLAAEDRAAKCFGFVSRYEPEPKRRLSAWLEGLGLQEDQPVTFLSDGGDTVRELPVGLHPHSEHLLDWFHITMRLTEMNRLAKGVCAEDQPELSADLEEMLEHLKWNLWHGKVDRALEITDELAYALDVEDASPEHRKLLKAVRAFEAYVTNHRAFIPNYGERFRQGETISTGFTESAVNQVVSKRFEKKQQMRWTASRCPFAAANPSSSAQRGLALDALALVPRHGGGSRKESRLASGLPCAVKRARWSSGRKLSHPATIAPAGNNRSGSGR